MSTATSPITEIPDATEEIKNPGYYTEVWNSVYDVLDVDGPQGNVAGLFSFPYKDFKFETRVFASQKSYVSFKTTYSSPDIYGHIILNPMDSAYLKLILNPSDNVKVTTTALISKINNLTTLVGFKLGHLSLQGCWSLLSGVDAYALYGVNKNVNVGLEAHHNYNSIENRNHACFTVQYNNPLYSFIASMTARRNIHLYFYRKINNNVELGASTQIFKTSNTNEVHCNTTVAAKFVMPRSGTTYRTSVDSRGSFITNITEWLNPSTSITLQTHVNPFLDVYNLGVILRYGPRVKNPFYFTPIIDANY